MANHAFLLLLLTSVANAVHIFGSNTPLPKQAEQLTLVWETSGGTLNPMVEPLTVQAGKNTSAIYLNNILLKGKFKSVNTTTAENVNSGDIALVSCDSTNSSFLSQDDVVGLIIPKNPHAIVLYSLASAHCGIEGVNVNQYNQFFTLRNITAETIRMFAAMPSANATIISSAVHDPTEKSEQPAPRNQTPAVAMSVLYAVTGIVTVLFLFIITTGAYRAHNNPARYGPRNGGTGRPRQSRAKGLAKAMLETLPIVKFGDPLPAKGENRDIELDITNTTRSPASTAQNEIDSEPKPGPQPDVTPVAAGAAAAAPESDEPASTSPPDPETANEHLGCSICTEDFTKGEDVRVLPCNHQYHPACIDPWLLNVSGTCPLCRVDLRPVRSNTSTLSSPTDADHSPAVSAEGAHHSRVQRILAVRHAPIHERMALLRQLARESSQQQQTQPTSTVNATPKHRFSLANRLFSGRTRGSDASDEAPVAEAAGGLQNDTATSTTSTAPAPHSATEGEASRP